ncbi:MAG: glycerophosphoryl diester phosphodiesterase [Actinomycetota bacterium]|nr:glycerophosphoryl diester phosphodiesterase [Actinomycetota bacterium]
MPASTWSFLDHPGVLAFAHRGGAGDWPENTMPAFEHAVQLGYRYVETDVHVTADGVLVAFHDDVLDRVTDRAGVISDLPWSEVSQARVDGREPIPRFEELLGAFPDLKVNIDPKHDASVEPLAAVIARAGAVDRVCIGAFSDERLERVRSLLPGVCTSLGPMGTVQLGLAASGEEVGALPSPCAQVPTHIGAREIVTPALLDEAHRRGMQVHVWTIDDPIEMERLIDLGVDGIMTDVPATLKDVLVARGRW